MKPFICEIKKRPILQSAPTKSLLGATNAPEKFPGPASSLPSAGVGNRLWDIPHMATHFYDLVVLCLLSDLLLLLYLNLKTLDVLLSMNVKTGLPLVKSQDLKNNVDVQTNKQDRENNHIMITIIFIGIHTLFLQQLQFQVVVVVHVEEYQPSPRDGYHQQGQGRHLLS